MIYRSSIIAMAEIIKRIFQSNGFRIYFWPIAICYSITALCFYLFSPLKPDSLRELTVVCILNFVWLGCLWSLVIRYRKITGKSVGERTIILLATLTALLVVSIYVTAFLKIITYFMNLLTYSKNSFLSRVVT